jgi:hypothetical protein
VSYDARPLPRARRQTDAAFVRDSGPSPEVGISRDLAKRGLIVAPLLVAVSAVIWGTAGAWSAAYAIALVLANFAGSALLIAGAAKISFGLMMGAVLFGYLIRLAIIFAAVWFVAEAPWISLPALGATIIVTHLGLLVWELKYVAISLAHSGVMADRDIANRNNSNRNNSNRNNSNLDTSTRHISHRDNSHQ